MRSYSSQNIKQHDEAEKYFTSYLYGPVAFKKLMIIKCQMTGFIDRNVCRCLWYPRSVCAYILQIAH